MTAAHPSNLRYTIDQAVSSLGFGEWRQTGGGVDYALFRWPPDVFAMAGTLLRESGAYLQVARPHRYPVSDDFWLPQWDAITKKIATEWRSLNLKHASGPPKHIRDLLDELARLANMPLHAISRPDPDRSNLTWMPLVKLMAFADEACRGAGVHIFGDGTYDPDDYVGNECVAKVVDRIASKKAAEAAGNNDFHPLTLCSDIVDSSRAIVLPKVRTSQVGATIRSLSLYLSLVNGSDVEPEWLPAVKQPILNNQIIEPAPKAPLCVGGRSSNRQAGPYNIVLFPYPHEIVPRQFAPWRDGLPCLGGRPRAPDCFFAYTPDRIDIARFRQRITNLIRQGRALVGPIHGIVLPELAMTHADFEKVFREGTRPFCDSLSLDFIVCGVAELPSERAGDELGRNYVLILQRLGSKWYEVKQEKHHRWALNSSQLRMYGLASILRPDKIWWEAVSLPRRSLNFHYLDSNTAYTVLICEDLSRPDPVGDVVRAVGPNLVICLVMDGPQLRSRWSARYATVLSDDPGSSVLTLSSLGMVTLSRKLDELHKSSRVVALWREPGESAVELTLVKGADALLLTLSASCAEERTIDGRHDHGSATRLSLAGVYQLNSNKDGSISSA